MQRSIVASLLVIASLQCGAQNTSIEYKSPDFATGGFRIITLQLSRDSRVKLIDSIAVWIGEAKSGGIYQWKVRLSGEGNWEAKNGLVNCTLDKSRQFLDTLFKQNQYRTKGLVVRNSSIIFSQELDTLFIDGIPCIKTVQRK